MSEQPRDLLRKELRQSRNALSTLHISICSRAICANAATLLADAQHIAGYYAFGAEVDLSTLMSTLESGNKTTYVPVVLPEFLMQFAPVDKKTPVVLNRYGIKEPQVDSTLYASASLLDAVLVPLVGFDERCNRMGMGGGYYDRCFAHRLGNDQLPLLIGVAYEMQCVETVHSESWDVPLDYVVTESRVLKRSSQ
ncbi:MAG: 5-formyltetrahydrofolate cyclo-ligase [Granulosicoccus sp.]